MDEDLQKKLREFLERQEERRAFVAGATGTLSFMFSIIGAGIFIVGLVFIIVKGVHG